MFSYLLLHNLNEIGCVSIKVFIGNVLQCNNVNGISIEYWVPECNWNISKKNLTSALTWPVTPWEDPV